MNIENFETKTGVVSLYIYSGEKYVGAEVSYKEFEKGQSMFDFTEFEYSIGVDSLLKSEWDEKSWVEFVVNAIGTVMILDEAFIGVEQLYISLGGDAKLGVPCSREDNISTIIKKAVTDKRLTNVTIGCQ
ncbi:hypothetical protein CI088_07580 [Enterococcus plantarum]|uniref:Uncharacterized protein n=1 Tax=Enterococcus plantarum TaxID=1077675 RepID=A0A2W3Z1W3_9ENTE|nr:hypothetical protein [Enterococcus plantarum]PZL74148.1 hypothetical protein CI088_07580 [Enterococcus plantarum]